MNLKSGLAMAALLLLAVGASGCGGNSGVDIPSGNDSGVSPPPPPPPTTGSSVGGIWIGQLVWEWNGLPGTGSTLNIRGLVAETGEFHWVPDDRGQQIFGTLQVSGTAVQRTGNIIWALDWGSENPAGDRWGGIDWFEGATVHERASLTGKFWSSWTTFEERIGFFSFAYDELYERDSSLAVLAGTYTTASDSLAIDDQGVLFYQSSANNCVGNGSVGLIDSNFNMYQVAIELESCTGSDAVRNGLTLTGLAYLDDSGGGAMNDVVEFAVSAENPDSFGFRHYVIWSLDAQK